MTLVTVESLEGPTDVAARLARGTLFLPHRWLRPDLEDPLRHLLQHRLEQAISSNGSASWTATDGLDAVALAVLQPLAWDSDVLGVPAARLGLTSAGADGERRHVTRELLRSAMHGASRAGIRHVSVRVDAADDVSIHELERYGFFNVDALMTFGTAIGAAPTPVADGRFNTRHAVAADWEAISEIAAKGFVSGRFHSDPSISDDTARRVYRAWAIGCCEGRAADVVLVAEEDGGIVGFVACKVQSDTAVYLQRRAGTIVLIAAGTHGRNVGSVLVKAAVEWFAGQQVVGVEVGTQLRNIPAARLYERHGFRLVAGALSFRFMID